MKIEFEIPVEIGETFFMLGSWDEVLSVSIKDLTHTCAWLMQISAEWGTRYFKTYDEAYEKSSQQYRKAVEEQGGFEVVRKRYVVT